VEQSISQSQNNVKRIVYIGIIFLLSSVIANAQYALFKKNNKWGATNNGAEFIEPIYDTILPFDSIKKICMVCVKTEKPATNKFIKMNNKIILCKYINHKKENLVLKIKNDTCTYFNYNKNVFNYYTNNKDYIVVSARDKKYIVTNQFQQISFTGYDEIIPLSITNHFLIETKTVGSAYLNGVMDATEKIIVPMEYTHIKSNPFDTLFIGCTAQIRVNGEDDVLDITGKKVHTFHRHIDNATKNFIIHKIFEPHEYYVIYDLATKKERIVEAEDITYLGNDVVNIKYKGKFYKSSLFKLDELKFIHHD